METTNRSISASFPDAIPYSQAAWGLDTTVLAYGTAFQLQGQGAPMAEGLPEEAKGIREQRKNDRDGNTLAIVNSLRVHRAFARQNLKPRFPTNQIRALRARASGRLWGRGRVYKASAVQLKSFGLGLARVRLS